MLRRMKETSRVKFRKESKWKKKRWILKNKIKTSILNTKKVFSSRINFYREYTLGLSDGDQFISEYFF